MDIKIDGLSNDLLRKALNQAKDARLFLLDSMYEVIAEPRKEPKPFVPRMETIFIDKKQIGAVIGPGGKVIQEMQEKTGTQITVDEDDKNGIVCVFSNNKEQLDSAVDMIKGIVAVPEVGKEYDAVVKSIMPYGAFVEYLPGKQGLLHISEISWSRVEKVEDVFQQNDKLKVKLVGIDPKSGKVRLSRKVLMPKPVENE
jgi:polyribonucleotide nucleotidyltransferase